MDKENKIEYPINRVKFKEGCISIFKRWNAFRLALDNNPQILTYYNEDESVLEINEYLEMLYDDILFTISKYRYNCNLIKETSDCLYSFISDYFQIDLEDQSDEEISKVLINLFNELIDGKNNLYNELKMKEKNNINHYNISFPIIGKQKIIFEKENEDESSENENSIDKNNYLNNDEYNDDYGIVIKDLKKIK